MGKLLVGVKFTTLNRLTWIVRLLCVFLMISSWLLFGPTWSVLLCSICILGYCSVSFLCYHPDAKPWRDRLDGWYEILFIWTLNYKHSKIPSVTDTQTSQQLHHPLSSHKDSLTGQCTNAQIKPCVACHKESQKMIQLIMRDFIHKWYGDVTNDDEFPEDVQKILEHVALEINLRMQQIDLEEIVTEIATLVVPYLEVVNEAGTRDFNGVSIFDVNHEKCQREFESNGRVAHRALQTSEHEIRYYRQALDAVILCAFPTEYKNCDVARMFVREILLQNIIEPVLKLLCDTDFLYEAIPIVLSKATPEKVERELTDIQQENEELERRLNHGKLVVKIKNSTRQENRRFHMSSTTFDQPDSLGGPSSPKRSPRPLSKSKTLPSMPPTSDRSSSPRRQSEGFPEQSLAGAPPSLYMTRSLPPETIGVETNSDFGSFEQVDSDLVYIQLAPIYIERSVRVVSGASSHTAYIFKFPKSLLSSEELKELEVLESDTHLEAMRRYSHFEKLHNSLLKSPLSLYVKGLELPDKRGLSSLVSKLPFTNSDPDPTLILERKQGLEKYLQSICSVPMIVNSEQFHKFLISGVKALREANIVTPSKSVKRRSFLGRVRPTSIATLGEETMKAEPIPKRPFEDVVSAYLNTHLPLPCHSFHSLYSTRTQQTLIQRSSTVIERKTHRESVSSPSAPPPPSAEETKTSPTQSLSSTTSAVHRESVGSLPAPVEHVKSSPAHSVASTQSGVTSHENDLLKMDSVDAGTDGSETSMATVYDPYFDTTFRRPVNSSGVSLPTKRQHGSVSYEEEEGQTTGMSYPLLHSLKSQTGGTQSQTGSLTSRSISSQPITRGAQYTQVSSSDPQNSSVSNMQQFTSYVASRVKQYFSHLLSVVLELLLLVQNIIKKGLTPLSHSTTISLAQEQKQKVPLSNALLILGSEVSKKHCREVWACGENTQLALLVLVGGGMERFLWKELKEVVYSEQNWSRALYHLRHTLWPGGKLMESSKKKLSEQERTELKKKAASAIKMFLPNFLPPVVGAMDYDKAVVHCLDCLQNPKLNRHFFLRLIDLMFMKMVPEINTATFQKELSRLRTLRQPRRSLGYGRMGNSFSWSS